jgi:hypothetical protein
MTTLYDSRSDTFIPITKPIVDENERVIWTFTLGIQIDTTSVYEYEKQSEHFETAILEMTKEMTTITDGLTYHYCHGMWLRKNQESQDNSTLEQENSSSIENNLSVQISVIILPDIANEIYNLIKHIISNVNKKYDLGLVHIQAMKTSGTAHHFISF